MPEPVERDPDTSPQTTRDRTPSSSSTGLDDNLGGALCYLLFFVSAVAFLILERENKAIRFHAYQSLGTFGGLFVLSVATSVIPFFGWLLGMLLAPVSIVLWLVLMVKTLQGDRVELPYIGNWAHDQSQR